MAKPQQAKPGRPSSFKEEYTKWAGDLAKLGATDKDLADAFGVSPQTVNAWKKAYPEFLDTLNTNKALADKLVESRLFSRAMGYAHEDTDIRVVDGQVVQTPIIKNYPPDTTACIFWLKNRQPKDWREKPSETDGEDKAPTPVTVVVEVKDARKNAEPESTAGPIPKPSA